MYKCMVYIQVNVLLMVVLSVASARFVCMVYISTGTVLLVDNSDADIVRVLIP